MASIWSLLYEGATQIRRTFKHYLYSWGESCNDHQSSTHRKKRHAWNIMHIIFFKYKNLKRSALKVLKNSIDRWTLIFLKIQLPAKWIVFLRPIEIIIYRRITTYICIGRVIDC